MCDFQKTMGDYRRQIERALDCRTAFCDCPQHRVKEAMRYSLLGAGKRIRGVLALEFCRLCGGKAEDALPLACAIEMIHAYSLIHDDLPCMDDDDLRRGKPSCHVAFGEATALLAGDALLTYAFQTALEGQTVPVERRLLVVKELAVAAGTDGMIGGQVMDIEGLAVDETTLRQMCAMKTGALIRVAARTGCLVGGGSDTQIAAADRYAQSLGLSFQIVDDILDATGEETALGKPIGSDVQNNKTTFVTLCGLTRAKEISDSLLHKAVGELEQFSLPDNFLVTLTNMLANRNK